MWGGNFVTMAPAKISSVEPRTWLLCWASRGIPIFNRPCRPGKDVKDSMLPQSHWQAWKKWESTKKEIETKATKAEVVQILEVISRDEIAMPSRTKKPKNTTHSKKAELPKDEGKMTHFRRHKVQALAVMRGKSSKSTADLLVGREVLRAGLHH